MCSLQNTIPIPVIVLSRGSPIVGVTPAPMRVRGKVIHIAVRLTTSSRNAYQSQTARGHHLSFPEPYHLLTSYTQPTPLPTTPTSNPVDLQNRPDFCQLAHSCCADTVDFDSFLLSLCVSVGTRLVCLISSLLLRANTNGFLVQASFVRDLREGRISVSPPG